MTRDEILNMPAERATDIKIAKFVMGHKITIGAPTDWSETKYTDANNNPCYPISHYSTDISAAWEVVLHFMNAGWCPNLINNDNGQWALSFVGVNDIPCTSQTSWIDDQRLWCDEAPLAICRAALLAVLEHE